MKDWPGEEILTGNYFLDEFDKQHIDHLLGNLTLDNCHIKFMTKKGTGDCLTEVEPIYNCKYKVESIPVTWLEKFSNPNILVSVSDRKILSYPPKNVYIPNEVSLIEKEKEDSVEPEQIYNDEYIVVMHLPIT